MFQVKGAIFTLLIALYGDTYYWTPRVERVLEACKRIEAPNRQHRPRVNELPGSIIGRMVAKISPTRITSIPELDRIPGDFFRTVFLLVIQFYCLARMEDCRKLRALNFSLSRLDGTKCITIHWPAMKNDPLYRGSFSHILQEGGACCPYFFIQMYFLRMNMSFGDDKSKDSSYVLPRLVKDQSNIQRPLGRTVLSYSGLVNGIKSVCKQVGFEAKVSGKSAKIGGASSSYRANLTPLQVMDKGRWKSEQSSLFYRRTGEHYNKVIASAISIQHRQPFGFKSTMSQCKAWQPTDYYVDDAIFYM